MIRFIFFVLFTQLALASDALTTNSFQEVLSKIEEKSQVYGRSSVLVVLDIDNTLLTSVNALGSDQWFSWQEEVMKQEGCEPLCITRDYTKLIGYQGLLFSIGKMRPTEVQLPNMMSELQTKGQKILLLTSRGHEFRSLTERSLDNAGMNFNSSAFGDRQGLGGTYLPYDLRNPSATTLTEDDIRKANLKDPRPVSYQNGIYMTSGQHKGVMLKVLLSKYQNNVKSIIFVDDHQRHVDRMQAILGEAYDVTTYRYGAIDGEVEAFKKSDKAEVTRRWYELKDALTNLGFAQN